MNTRQGLTLVGAALALSGIASAQTYRTLATETFEYPAASTLGNTTGGTGWSSEWYAGPNGDWFEILSPGFDSVGNLARDVIDDDAFGSGAFRRLDLSPYPALTDDTFGSAGGPLLGADGTTLWVTFTSAKLPGGSDAFGGLSFFIFLDPNGVGEYLFLGSPYLVDQWGIDGLGQVDFSGFSPNTLHTLVYRVDFQAGDEYVQLWVDPAVPHPSGTPDAEVAVPDFRFNEVRIASGSGAFGTEPGHGWDFDNIVIECQDCDDPTELDILTADKTQLSLFAGDDLNMTIDAGPEYANQLYYMFGSLAGTSPGIPVDAWILPLVLDNYLLYTFNNPNGPILQNNLSTLDANGQGSVTLDLPAGQFLQLSGGQIHHALVTIDVDPVSGFPFVSAASNSVTADLF